MASAAITLVSGIAASAASSAAVGALGLAAGSLAGTLVGVAVGAVVGGAVSAVGAAIMGEDIGDAFTSGAITGGLAGGVAGYMSGTEAGAESGIAEVAETPSIESEIEIAGTMESPRPLGEVFSDGADTVFGSEQATGVAGETGADVIKTGGENIVGSTAAAKAADAAPELTVAEQAQANISKGVAGDAKDTATEGGKLLAGAKKVWNGLGDTGKGAAIQTGGGMLQYYAESQRAKEKEEEEDQEEAERLARLNESGNFSKYASFSSEYAV